MNAKILAALYCLTGNMPVLREESRAGDMPASPAPAGDKEKTGQEGTGARPDSDSKEARRS